VRIAIIGGSGFIGTELTRQLLESGRTVRILDKVQSLTYPELRRAADVRDLKTLVNTLDGCDVIYNLAAEHKDNVKPASLYQDVNVAGALNVCRAAEELGVKSIIFTSSVAVYGFAPPDTDESGELQPFNEYGRTKMEAERVYEEWQGRGDGRSLTIVRPTVVFGPRNRGNVYNLLRQMESRKFIMVGSGRNEKSMAYVVNVAAFLVHCLSSPSGKRVFNYVDKPDLSMERLVLLVRKCLGRSERIVVRIPYCLGYLAALIFDISSLISGKEFAVSRIRMRKFCAITKFSSSRIEASRFTPPVKLIDALEETIREEFMKKSSNSNDARVVFYSE
jgi:nucleoside-diphosphate-sugar epimerase